MGYGKSSRVTVMNYIYKINSNSVTESYHTEEDKIDAKFGVHSREWNFNFLKRFVSIVTKSDYEIKLKDSFHRTKKWVLKNHPELLL
jgi:hypothetical protein